MSEAAKVITLDPVLSSRQRTLLEQLPPAIRDIRQTAHMVSQALLSRFFDLGHDALFHYAEAGASTDEQLAVYDACKTLREQQPSFIQQFTSGIDVGFAALLEESRSNSNETPLAWQIPLETAANNCIADNDSYLASLNTRLTHLLERAGKPITNPISPSYLSDLFTLQARRLSLSNTITEILVDVFCGAVLCQLHRLYNHSETLLTQAGVPEARELDTYFASRHLSKATKRASDEPRNSYAETHNTDVLTHTIVENILAEKKTVKLSRKAVVKILDVAQREFAENTVGDLTQNITGYLQKVQQNMGVTGYIPNFESELITLVCVVFDSTVKNNSLDKITKGYIGRLLIPVIKVALIDKSFLSNCKHDVRELLNELVMRGLGWAHESDPKQHSESIRIIDKITRNITQEFSSDTAIFTEALRKLRKLQEQEEKQISLLATRLNGSAKGKERLTKAEKKSQDAITQTIEDLRPAAIVEVFATKLWQQVLLVTALEEGDDSTLWQERYSVLTELCHLATPCKDPKDKLLRIKKLPQIMPRIQTALALCANNAFDCVEILEALHKTLGNCLRGQLAEKNYTLKNQHEEEAPAPGSVENLHISIQTDENVGASAPASTVSTSTVSTNTGSTSTGSDGASISGSEPAEPEKATYSSAAKSSSLQQHSINKAGSVKPATRQMPKTAMSPAAMSPAAMSPAATGKNSISDSADDAELRQQIQQFPRGTLFKWQEGSDNIIRCRLAAIIKQTQRYIFTNRNGLKVAELSENEMLTAIKQGHLTLIEQSMVFDQALSKVVSDLRRNSDNSGAAPA